MSKSNNLQSNPIYKEACSLTEYTYDIASIEFTSLPDEKWNTERKLRTSANDLLSFTAQAVSNKIPGAAEYDWNNAHKALFTMQTMCNFADKQGFVELDPKVMERMDVLLEKIDKELHASIEDQKNREKEALKPWQDKYKLWKEMAGDKRS